MPSPYSLYGTQKNGEKCFKENKKYDKGEKNVLWEEQGQITEYRNRVDHNWCKHEQMDHIQDLEMIWLLAMSIVLQIF